ncbi:hypothetical protein ACNTMW_05895 [Planosporangium sp. 12N6]
MAGSAGHERERGGALAGEPYDQGAQLPVAARPAGMPAAALPIKAPARRG